MGNAAADAPAVVLRAEGVGKQFFRKTRESARDFDAVAEVDLQLAPGEVVELVGRSGSGKTTLLNMMAGLLEPSAGRVLFGETDLYTLSDADLSRFRNQHFGVVPQGQTALHSLTVLQNVTLPVLMYGSAEAAVAEARAFELLKRLGIANLADAYPRELSGGEMRRMAIARALVSTPDVLFADEPTGDLDDQTTDDVLGLLRESADAGMAVLLVTHEHSAARIADRIVRMDAGRLAAS